MDNPSAAYLNQPVDVSGDFECVNNTFFHADKLTAFDAAAATGSLRWVRRGRKPRMAFDETMLPYEPQTNWEFPPEYVQDPETAIALSWISTRAVRLRIASRTGTLRDEPSLMLAGDLPMSSEWAAHATDNGVEYRSPHGRVTITRDPWHIEFRNAQGKLLTSTVRPSDCVGLLNCFPTPFSQVRRSADLARRMAASFSLAHDEGIYGCGESFTRLNKRGQRVVLCASDPYSVQRSAMYKPIPFFLSSRGYGMFIHATTPITCDFGHSFDGATTLFVGDDQLDLFFFFGEAKEVIAEYTALTGRSPMPPLWSFGLWMSRCTYKSEAETREVASDLRKHKVPCDVIHLDTGWFETDWRCDYRFSTTRFPDPAKMIADLRQQGFRISLWQLPYFAPTNPLYREAIDKGYVVRSPDGGLPTEDAVLDFSNPDAVRWYQGLLAGLLRMGAAAIKVDFGEASPIHGQYASGRSGFQEHNLYPLRYNKAVAEITREITGENIIWARSTWAGSQRYPLHWGGDAENTDSAMAATLRAGLSLGLCGFSFWSHDIGGLVRPTPERLYRRWTAFGMLTSHSRCHGAPPKEPWAYSADLLRDFRLATELKYRLMPYIYAQAKDSSNRGLPMLRALFVEYPGDPTSWLIEDQYLLGTDLLVAPLFEEATGRRVYLPPGKWVDYQTRRPYSGAQWHHIKAGPVPCVIMVRDGAAIPHAALEQCTDDIDWSNIELEVFAADANEATALLYLPGDAALSTLVLRRTDKGFALTDNPMGRRVTFHVNCICQES